MRVARQVHLAKLRAQRVIDNQLSGARLAVARQHFDGFHRLQGANHAHQRSHHARFHAGQRVIAKKTAQAAVARRVGLPRKDADLALHADSRAGDQRHLMMETGGVKLIARRHVIGAVEHQVMAGDKCRERGVIELCVDRFDNAVRVNGGKCLTRRFHLRLTDGGVAVQHLALEIGERDGIEIEQRQPAGARRGQIRRGRAAKTAEAHHQHAGSLQPFLPVKIEIPQDDLPVIAQHLGIA